MSTDRERLAAALHGLWAPGDPSNIDVAVAALDAADALLPVVQALVAEGAAAAEERGYERARRDYQFQPSGDNHHNAALCPYCSPPSDRADALRRAGSEANR